MRVKNVADQYKIAQHWWCYPFELTWTPPLKHSICTASKPFSAHLLENSKWLNIPTVHGHQPAAPNQNPKPYWWKKSFIFIPGFYSSSEPCLQNVCIHSSFAHLSPIVRLVFKQVWYGHPAFPLHRMFTKHNAITPCVPEKLITFGEQSQLWSLWKKGAKERGSVGGGWGYAEVLNTAQNKTINVRRKQMET